MVTYGGNRKSKMQSGGSARRGSDSPAGRAKKKRLRKKGKGGSNPRIRRPKNK